MGIIALLTALFTAITEVSKGIVMLIPDLLALVKAWKAYYDNIEIRQADAVKAQIEAQLQAQTNQARKEVANQRAFLFGLESAWATRYQQILSLIGNEQYGEVLILTDTVDYPPVDEILFNTDYSNESKARKIIAIMKGRGLA